MLRTYIAVNKIIFNIMLKLIIAFAVIIDSGLSLVSSILNNDDVILLPCVVKNSRDKKLNKKAMLEWSLQCSDSDS